MSDDDFVFGDNQDESLFGSSESIENDSERRFGTSGENDSPTHRFPLNETIGAAATIVLAAALVVTAVAVAYPLVMDAFDTGGPSEEGAPSGKSAPTSRTPLSTSDSPPVTEIVISVEEPTGGQTESVTREPGATPTETARATTEPSATTLSTTERTTVPVNEFPAGDPDEENQTADRESRAVLWRQSAA